MGYMKKKKNKKMTESEIDKIVIEDADNDAAWTKAVKVNPSKPISIRLSENVIISLKQLAKLKGEKGYQTLIKKWVIERLQFENKIISSITKKTG